LPYPYDLNISLYFKTLACAHSQFLLLEQSRTVKKMARVVKKVAERGQEKAKYGLRKPKGEIILPDLFFS